MTVAFAAWGLGGSSDGRPNDGASREIGQAKAQVAELDKERRRREDALADLERRKNAKESELAQTSDRVEGLEKRRAQLQTEIAELVAPVSPSGAERVLDQGGAPQTLRELDDETLASAAPLNPIPLPPSAPAASKISVDADAESPMDAPPEAQRDRPSPDGVARIARAEPETETDDAAGARTEQAIPVGGMRVFIHVRASDPAARDRARAIAAELRRHGVEVADIRGVPHAVRRDAVRYFYDADRASASLLQKAVRAASPLTDQTPMAQDFRRYSAPPRQGTVELWLS
ncbi:hypothetical protein [Hansschlegelia sp. KR7-227]|uniref:hypothetical protein n=1 Tax=Hansschlegelia sp. KR7-227 TaxID=3400914 RepID=UPI003C06A17A